MFLAMARTRVLLRRDVVPHRVLPTPVSARAYLIFQKDAESYQTLSTPYADAIDYLRHTIRSPPPRLQELRMQ
jgi:hypothetical protein